MLDRIKAAADDVFPEIVRLRRTIHRNPELAYEEHETARLVRDTLVPLGLSLQSGIAGTGIAATLEGQLPGPCVLLRADMDALPIAEETGLDFDSQSPGRMHACGHDMHTSSLLGTAMVLAGLRHGLPGSVRFIFQPSEERLPSGAQAMIRAGVLDHGQAAAFGQHVFPALPAGTIGIRPGLFMASADEVRITVRGRGGHAAEPHLLQSDVMLAACHTVVALQGVISRHCPPDVPSLLSFGNMTADGATNILPNAVHIEGTFRAMQEEWRFRAHDLISSIAADAARTFGAEAAVDIATGPPAVFNDPGEARLVREAAEDYVGRGNTREAELWFGGEDFAYFLQEVPGAFYQMGVGCPHALHTPRFTIDEEALRVSTGFMAYLAWKRLTSH